MTKEKGQSNTGSRTYLIDSIQLQDIMRYLMSRPYAEVVKLMNGDYFMVFNKGKKCG